MKPLLPTDSPTYLRRLVRALNRMAKTGGAFHHRLRSRPSDRGYYSVRCNRARLTMVAGGYRLDVRLVDGRWMPSETTEFKRPGGGYVIASIQP